MRTLIKVCGVTTPADAQVVSAAGVDVIGVNFDQNSSRYVTPACAAEIARVANGTKLVGVTVAPVVSSIGTCGRNRQSR